jgi:ferredoxin-NADP reductase
MLAYKIRLIKKETIAHGTMAFHFEKPDGFVYRAGQYGDFTLINPPETDSEGNKRSFSLASAPYEAEFVIATRIRDTAFKRVLKSLPEGSELEFEGPYGSFMLPETPATPAVFLTGGIGSTIVRSMIIRAMYERLQQKITLFHSNRSPQDSAFLAEFAALATQNENFSFVPTMTKLNGQDWTGEQGNLTIYMLKKYVEDITVPIYYLSGPTAMVAAMSRMLTHAGVNRYNFQMEQFVGY